MFRVDRGQNRISRLTQKRFGELALRERDHLQEWLVHQPDALGEELLIIQPLARFARPIPAAEEVEE